MRINFLLSENFDYSHFSNQEELDFMLEFKTKGFFVDFPCRVLKEDNFHIDEILFENYWALVLEFDRFSVECTGFSHDENGYYQKVWLE